MVDGERCLSYTHPAPHLGSGSGSSSSSSSSSNTTGAIVGGVMGRIGGLVLFGLAAIFPQRRHNKRQQPKGVDRSGSESLEQLSGEGVPMTGQQHEELNLTTRRSELSTVVNGHERSTVRDDEKFTPQGMEGLTLAYILHPQENSSRASPQPYRSFSSPTG